MVMTKFAQAERVGALRPYIPPSLSSRVDGSKFKIATLVLNKYSHENNGMKRGLPSQTFERLMFLLSTGYPTAPTFKELELTPTRFIAACEDDPCATIRRIKDVITHSQPQVIVEVNNVRYLISTDGINSMCGGTHFNVIQLGSHGNMPSGWRRSHHQVGSFYGSTSTETYDEEGYEDYEEVSSGPQGQMIMTFSNSHMPQHVRDWWVGGMEQYLSTLEDWSHTQTTTVIGKKMVVITTYSTEREAEEKDIGDLDEYRDSYLTGYDRHRPLRKVRPVLKFTEHPADCVHSVLCYLDHQMDGCISRGHEFQLGLGDLLCELYPKPELSDVGERYYVITDNVERRCYHSGYSTRVSKTHDLIIWLNENFEDWRDNHAHPKWWNLRWVPFPVASNPNEGNHDIIGGAFYIEDD
jgi:hypothetical protein